MIDKEAIKELKQAEDISAAVGAVAMALGRDELTDTRGVAALPSEFNILDLEKYLPIRRRARGAMETDDLASFASYTHQHAESGATVFVDPDKMAARAVLNLGEPDVPGHADNVAVLGSKRTAAYTAMLSICSGTSKQATASEWLEDWTQHIKCYAGNDPVANGVAVQSVRNLTIEEFRKMESTVEQLSSTLSAFESVKAGSKTALPTMIYFTCAPYAGFLDRTFVIRLGVLTGDNKPALTLRVIKFEEHQQEMAQEMAERVRNAINPSDKAVGEFDAQIPVLVGSYAAKN